MRQWVKKLVDQLDVDWKSKSEGASEAVVVSDLNEDRATLLYILDVMNKHIIETDQYPLRKVRETLDELSKGLVDPRGHQTEKILFRLRQFFSSHRIDEYTYVQKTFDDFKSIIWDFADQLGEEIRAEEQTDEEIKQSLDQLREAVEANSIEGLRIKSREFIDFYMESQTRRDESRARRLQFMSENLASVKKKLVQANKNLNVDHLTSAFNRRSFDDQAKKLYKLFQIAGNHVTLLALDIDHFKKINDCYGHDIGDFVLKECVRFLKEVFQRENDFVARTGGEEFAILLPDFREEHAIVKVEELLKRIRQEVFVHDKLEIKFTISVGIAQLYPHEDLATWLKRADEALYHSKKTGRDKYSVAIKDVKVAS